MNSPHSSFQLSAFNFQLFPNPSTLKTTVKRLAPLLAALCLMQGAHSQTTAVPGFISYQGRALNSSGTVMGSGTPVNRTLTFRIWNHATNSLTENLLYSEQQVVTIAEGEFSVLVGAGAAVTGESAKGPPTVKINDLGVFAGVNRYLGVTIDDGTDAVDNEVSPRQQIVASAYALRAKYAEQLGSNGGTALTALDSGNVGIGNTNPPARFTVTGANIGTSSANPQLIVTDNADPNKRLRIGVDSTGNGTGFIQSFKDGTGAQNLLLNPSGGGVGIGGPASSTTALSVTGAITATGAITGGSFATAGNITASSGDVGIGTTSPSAQLHLNGAAGTGSPVRGKGALYLQDSGASVGNGGALLFGASQGMYAGIKGYAVDGTTNSRGDLAFHTRRLAADADLTESMRITYDGNVGIGTTNPTSKLDVAGNTYVRGQINLDSAIVMGNGPAIWGKSIAGVFEQAFWPRSSDGTYINYGASGFYIRNNASTNIMVMLNNGKVGIGNDAPGFPLTMASTLGDKIALFSGSGSASYGFGIQGSLLQIHTDTSGSDVAFGHGSSAAMVETMRIKGNGNVGIGTTAPGAKLQIADGGDDGTNYGSVQIIRHHTGHLGSHLSFVRAAQTVMGLGYGQSSSSFGFGPGTATAFSPTHLSIDTAGKVQIGTTLSAARLSVGSVSAITSILGYLDSLGGQSGDSNISRSLSIQADGVIVSPLVAVNSDLRIKTDLHAADAVKDLETLMAIEVTDYHYKDKIAHGNGPQKKVIAQQVEKVYPQAVNTTMGVVPDIYKKAGVKDGWIELATDLKVGERVRLILPSGESLEEVLEVRGDAFRSRLKSAVKEIFVYGREVNDFRSVDYDAIAMLNVSATQELARQLETVQAENAALRRELAAKDRELATKDESMEARLIALERRMSGESVPVTVSLKTASTAK